MKLETLLKGRWIKQAGAVLRPGEPGEWDDLMADCPSIFADGKGRHYIYYTGHSTRDHRWGIGLCESSDLMNWKKSGRNPVLRSGGRGEWDQRIDGPALFKHNEMYYLFYEASSSFSFSQSRLGYIIPYPFRKRLGALRRGARSLWKAPLSQAALHADGRAIGFATSKDMLDWEKHPENPVLTPSGDGWDSTGVLSPHVQSAGGVFYMFYGGCDGKKISSGVATSGDLRHWLRKGSPVLEPGDNGSWDDSSVLIVSVLRLEDAYCAFYEGQDSLNNYGIGLAYSHDLNRWTKHKGNPVMERGPLGSADERMVNSPHVLLKDGKLFLFFGAQDYKMRGQSSLACFEGGAV